VSGVFGWRPAGPTAVLARHPLDPLVKLRNVNVEGVGTVLVRLGGSMLFARTEVILAKVRRIGFGS